MVSIKRLLVSFLRLRSHVPVMGFGLGFPGRTSSDVIRTSSGPDVFRAIMLIP